MAAEQIIETMIAQVRGHVQEEIELLVRRESGQSQAKVEQRLEDLMGVIRQAVLQAVGQALGTGYGGSQMPCECGAWMRFVGHRRKTVLTLLGDLHLQRAYYSCAHCRATRVPLDEQLDIVRQGQSAGVKLVTALTCALLPNAQAMGLLEELKLPHVSVKESQRLTLEVGQRAIGQRDEEARRWCEQRVGPGEHVRREAPERLAVLMDGTTAHTDGDWHEVKVGTFYTFDEEGKATGEKGHVATFEKIDHFRSLWDTEAQRWHLGQAPHVVALCDGAAWTWNIIAQCCPEHTVQILDFYHATEHLWTLARTLFGEASKRAARWVDKQKERLLHGRLDDFFCELKRRTRQPQHVDEAGKQLRYFQNNRQRLDYAAAISRGDPIGSGMVEAACKTLICVREKQPGMRWRKDTADAIAHLRCLYYSARWQRFRQQTINSSQRAA